MGETIKAVGRPAGKSYPVIKQIRLGTGDAEQLSRLAREWRCSEAAAVRRAIHEKALENRDVRRRPRDYGREELRLAAERARDYYATDPGALEWAEFVGDEPDDAQG